MPARTNFYSVNRSLLNPDFEAYKLSSATLTAASYQLPSAVTLAGLNPADANGPLLGYKELKDRLDSQKLVHGSIPGHLAYIDDTGFVILVVFDEASRKPSFNPIHRTNAVASQVAQGSLYLPSLPSLSALSDGRWLVSDGQGELVVLGTSKQGRRWSSSIIAEARLENMTSFRILTARETTDDTSALVLVQACRKEPLQPAESSDRASRTKAAAKTVFDVSLLQLDLSASLDEYSERLKLLWTVTGEEAVYYARLGEKAEDAHLLLSEGTFAARDTKSSQVSEQAEISSSSQVAPPTANSAKGSSRPASFTWLQTPDSVTVIFQLPPTLSKKDIRVHFSPHGLSLTLASTALDELRPKIQEITEDSPENEAATASDPLLATAQLIMSGRYRSRSLWAPIEASSSVWTWEQVGKGDQLKGLLTLHLEKKDERTRWLKVFEGKSKAEAADAGGSQRPMIGGSNSVTRKTDETRLYELEAQAAQQTNEDEVLDDPPEIIDPSELAMMIEGLDKYTADGEFDDPAIPRPGGPTLSTERESLLRDQLEPEDAVVGKRLRASLITGSRDGVRVVETTGSDQTDYCLAEPLPHCKTDGTREDGLATRHELDGLVLTSDDKTTSSSWQHVDTLPALSFVLASKRDLNRVYLHRHSRQNNQRSIVLAFESSRERTELSTPQDQNCSTSAGNLFVYYGQPGTASKGKYAESRVIRLGIEEEGASGALMGAAAVDVPTGEADGEEKETILVCLCERRLLILRGVF